MKNAFAGLLVMGLAIAGCGAGPIALVNGPQTPAADGHVGTEVGENGNLKLTVEVKHLASPDKVTAGAKVYVVWIAPASGAPQSVGVLKVDDDLTGHLETTTAQHNFDLYITTEAEPTAVTPSGARVLSAKVIR